MAQEKNEIIESKDPTKKSSKKKEDIKEIYPILPLRNTVLFPQQIFPVYIGRKQSLQLIDNLPSKGKMYLVVIAKRDGIVENPEKKDLHD